MKYGFYWLYFGIVLLGRGVVGIVDMTIFNILLVSLVQYHVKVTFCLNFVDSKEENFEYTFLHKKAMSKCNQDILKYLCSNA